MLHYEELPYICYMYDDFSPLETGLCFCTFSDNRRVYAEKTKAGYTIKAWREEKE